MSRVRMRLAFVLFLGACGAFAQTPVISCASGTNAAQEGQSISCTSSIAVTWSLSGPGSLSNQAGTTVTYTAPSSLTNQHLMGACPVMPDNSIFNQRIDNLPIMTASSPGSNGNSSATMIAHSNPTSITFAPSWGIAYVNNSTPTRNLKNFYGGSVNGFPIPTASAAKEEEGYYKTRTDNADHHIMAVNTQQCTFWDVYNLHSQLDPFAGECNGGGTGCNAAGSIAYWWYAYNVTGGTNAASLPLAPLTPHLDEIHAGAINHALWFTTQGAYINYANFLWPAATANGYVEPNAPPMGARFRLRLCNGSITTNCVTLSNYSAYQQEILLALNNYGMFLADIGSGNSVSISDDLTTDPNVYGPIASLGGIPISDFDVVDESSLQYAANSIAVCPYSTTTACMSGNAPNSYEVPVHSVMLTGTPTGGGSAATIPIALQGVAVGLNAPEISMMSGNYSYQIPSWVSGTTNQSVTWSLVSGPGSVTAGGVYTPPRAVVSHGINSPGVELGTKFYADENGYIQGLRFYKGPADTGTHTGSLWRCSNQTCSAGTLLASGTYSGESASGWQTLTFGSAVAITANTVYVTSYHTTGTYDGGLDFWLTGGVDNGDLHAPADAAAGGVDGPNSVYTVGTGGTFPSNGNYATVYWSDVIFSTSSSGGTQQNLFSASTTPLAGNTTILKGTSIADSNAFALEYITLLPYGASPNGSIRIDSGQYPNQTFDVAGKIWQPDCCFETATYAWTQGDYPDWRNSYDSNWNSSNLPQNPEISVYQSVFYSDGNDIEYNFIVPNGNYKVRMLFGHPYNGHITGAMGDPTFPFFTPPGGKSYDNLETQGNLIWHNFNYGLNQPGYEMMYATPNYVYLPAKVTNNTLEIGLYGVFYDADVYWTNPPTGSPAGTNCGPECTAPEINGLEIAPDSTPAHWTIDTQQRTTVNAGQSLWQFQTSTAGNSYELGNMFIPTTSGYITGVRFYKGVGDTGTHTGSLWTINGNYSGTQTGTQLATGTFTGETSSGWQTLTFATPVAVTAGIQYVISYHTTSGLLYFASNFFSPGTTFVNGPLLGYGGIWVGSSGGVFPTNMTTAAYAADPIFSLSSSGTNPVTLFPASGLPGQQLQLYVQDWYTGLSDAQWSIVSGPGTIAAGTDLNGNACGIYTPPSTQPSEGVGVTIQAQSASNPLISATVTLYFSGSQLSVK